jgi:hypothetical protein
MSVTASPNRTYLVECYEPGIAPAEVASAGDRALTASVALRQEGRSVEYVGAILVPGDEVVFHVFAADCAATVCAASARASVPYERVVESVTVGRLRLTPRSHEP